mmetsp:Transcript_104933/g.128114  ORF Transcript_104933/g.128114 Transcript_104933/m.128114 type:complete len:141 (+) Transcript_104933:67-489(+)
MMALTAALLSLFGIAFGIQTCFIDPCELAGCQSNCVPDLWDPCNVVCCGTGCSAGKANPLKNMIFIDNHANTLIGKIKAAPMMIHIVFGLLVGICLASILCTLYNKCGNSRHQNIKYTPINDIAITSPVNEDTNDVSGSA